MDRNIRLDVFAENKIMYIQMYKQTRRKAGKQKIIDKNHKERP